MDNGINGGMKPDYSRAESAKKPPSPDGNRSKTNQSQQALMAGQLRQPSSPKQYNNTDYDWGMDQVHLPCINHLHQSQQPNQLYHQLL